MAQEAALNREAARRAVSERTAVGAFLGLAWGTALRAWMVTLALQFGEQPTFTWTGTFGGVLLPAALMGAILGGVSAEDTSKRRWVLLSPLLLIAGPALATKNFVPTLISTGMGGGAIGVALIGMLGGFALSGFGAAWLRRAAGVIAGLFSLAAGIGLSSGAGVKAATSDSSKAFCGLLFVLLMLLLIAGISAPFRSRPNGRAA